jgi:hypothetical protein
LQKSGANVRKPPGGDPGAGTKREILSTREAAGFAYRILYIDPMLVRSALNVCAITPFVADAVAEDPALAAVLAEAFETFPGALDPFAPRQSSQGCRTRCGARCDRKIGQPGRPDDNTAVRRARASLDTAIENLVTALGSSAGLLLPSRRRRRLGRSEPLTWHFKARFGITPGRYARLLKNGRTAGRGS